MTGIEKILVKMKNEPANVRFFELKQVCTYFFNQPRSNGSSHMVFKTPWQGEPRINIQNDKGKAKAYQVKQVLAAIQKLGEWTIFSQDDRNGC